MGNCLEMLQIAFVVLAQREAGLIFPDLGGHTLVVRQRAAIHEREAGKLTSQQALGLLVIGLADQVAKLVCLPQVTAKHSSLRVQAPDLPDPPSPERPSAAAPSPSGQAPRPARLCARAANARGGP